MMRFQAVRAAESEPGSESDFEHGTLAPGHRTRLPGPACADHAGGARGAANCRAGGPRPARDESAANVAVASPPAVSVVIPARNEEAALAAALDSVRVQDYAGAIEIIVADGSDGPAMADMVRLRFPEVRIVANPRGHTAAGLNRAVRAAAHSVIVRCDARCVLPPDYVRTAVATLRRTAAANVGGRQCPVGTSAFTRAVALAMTTALGAGNARYRLGGAEGPVDTVFLGVFRREVLEAAGGFDETLLRNQDYALNWRLRERGETVWFDPALRVQYRPREHFGALARQYFAYGWWKRIMLGRNPGSWRWRQLAPPCLAFGLAASAALAAAGMVRTGALLPAAYLLLLLGGAACTGVRRRSIAALLLPPVLATMQLAWAAGFWCALVARRR